MRLTLRSGTLRCTSGAVGPVWEGRVETDVADVTMREELLPLLEESPALELGASDTDVAGGGVDVEGGAVTAAVEEGSV